MKVQRIKRWILTLICGFSLALFLMVVGLWLWSDRTVAERRWNTATQYTDITSSRGEIEVDWGTPMPDPAGDPQDTGWMFRPAVQSESLSSKHDPAILGFIYQSHDTSTASQNTFLMPDWSLLILFAFLPLFWLLRTAGLLTSRGYCHNCGSSFRDRHNRCPKCGTVWV